MARDLNKVMLTGRLGKTPELRYLPNGTAVATFSVASGRSVKQTDGSYQEQTEWFRVVAWEKLAETCANYLKTGSHVFIEGRMQTRKYQDKETNLEKQITEVVANEMLMLDSKRSQEEDGGGSSNGNGNSYQSNRAPARSGAAAPKGRANDNPFEDEADPEDLPF